MGVDPLSPIAPARLRALLLPIGKIKQSRFLSFAKRVQAENVVRLGDISPDARPNRSMRRLDSVSLPLWRGFNCLERLLCMGADPILQ